VTSFQIAESVFHGHRSIVLQTPDVVLEILRDAGPRIISFSAPGGRNLFAWTPNTGWETVHGRPYRLLGGHRLWSAPECPAPEHPPDDIPVDIEIEDDAAVVSGGGVTHEGLERSLRIAPIDGRTAVTVTHTLSNPGPETRTVAAWALTQLVPGGRATIPYKPGSPEAQQLPNRNIVLWPYTSWDDPRLEVDDNEVRVAADEEIDAPCKVGSFVSAGSAWYELDGCRFTKRFNALPGLPHADLGTNVEVYSCSEFLELETLGPLETLRPGESVRHEEQWELTTA
jgi:hypothetical protein